MASNIKFGLKIYNLKYPEINAYVTSDSYFVAFWHPWPPMTSEITFELKYELNGLYNLCSHGSLASRHWHWTNLPEAKYHPLTRSALWRSLVKRKFVVRLLTWLKMYVREIGRCIAHLKRTIPLLNVESRCIFYPTTQSYKIRRTEELYVSLFSSRNNWKNNLLLSSWHETIILSQWHSYVSDGETF